MATKRFYDRVKESTVTTGTGTLTLGGAVAQFRAFSSVLNDGEEVYYGIAQRDASVNEWEVGYGVWNTGGTLTRATILAGSNGTSAVNFSAGTKDVFICEPAQQVNLPYNYCKVQDVKTAGTAGGGFTSGSWQTRALNTLSNYFFIGGSPSLSANRLTLPAGSYRCLISAPAYIVVRHKIRLRNVTDGTTVLVGTSEVSNSSALVTRSLIQGNFTVAASKELEVQHRCQTTRATDGFGLECNFDEEEVYTVAEFWRLAS